MLYTDLSPSTRPILIGLVIVVQAALLIRATIFFRFERAGIHPLYPDSWNAAQCKALESFRLLLGLALIPLWAAYLFVAPSIRTNWPFGYFDLISLISMLSVSYAWTILLATRNWKVLEALPHSFLVMAAFLVLWWGTAFSAIGWMFAQASAPPPFRGFPSGVYAERPAAPVSSHIAAVLHIKGQR
jgi:hypothetical protein